MNKATADELRTKWEAIRVELTARKAHDYADDTDVLSDFKKLSAACVILGINLSTPEGVSLFYMLHKLARLANLVDRQDTPACETMGETVIDEQVYADCLHLLLVERTAKPTKSLYATDAAEIARYRVRVAEGELLSGRENTALQNAPAEGETP